MIIIQQVEGTTPRGRQWKTQISYDTNDLKSYEDNLKQLEYERSQLL